jgi:hypothetical protein
MVAMVAFYLACQLASPGLYKRSGGRYSLLILLLVVSLGLHLYREFILGQVNLVLLLSYLLILKFMQLKKPVVAALVLAIGVMFKPWGIIFLPWFLLRGNYRVVLFFLLFTAMALVTPVIFYGYHGMLEQTGRWFQEMAVEIGGKQQLDAMSNLTVFSVIYRYTPMRFMELSAPGALVFQGVVLILMGVATWWFMLRGTDVKKKEVAEGALLIGMMPLIAPANYNTYLMIGLALALLFIHFRELPSWAKVFLICGVILQGGNYNDVWGTELSNYFLGLSLVTIGSMLILSMLFVLRYRRTF